MHTSTFTTAELASWVDYLAECDQDMHWCPDLAGVIASAPLGALKGRTRQYGTCGEVDRETGEPEQMRPHPWTVDSVARWAVVQLAALDVCEGRAVSRDLGAVLVDLMSCGQLSPETADELADLLARLWDILLDPDLVSAAVDADEAAVFQSLQTAALGSIGL